MAAATAFFSGKRAELSFNRQEHLQDKHNDKSDIEFVVADTFNENGKPTTHSSRSFEATKLMFKWPKNSGKSTKTQRGTEVTSTNAKPRQPPTAPRSMRKKSSKNSRRSDCWRPDGRRSFGDSYRPSPRRQSNDCRPRRRSSDLWRQGDGLDDPHLEIEDEDDSIMVNIPFQLVGENGSHTKHLDSVETDIAPYPHDLGAACVYQQSDAPVPGQQYSSISSFPADFWKKHSMPSKLDIPGVMRDCKFPRGDDDDEAYSPTSQILALSPDPPPIERTSEIGRDIDSSISSRLVGVISHDEDHDNRLPIPLSAAFKRRFLTANDETLSMTSSTTASSRMSIRRKRCASCKSPGSDLNILIPCSTCSRKYHTACGTPRPSSFPVYDEFTCGRCVRQNRMRDTVYATPALHSSPLDERYSTQLLSFDIEQLAAKRTVPGYDLPHAKSCSIVNGSLLKALPLSVKYAPDQAGRSGASCNGQPEESQNDSTFLSIAAFDGSGDIRPVGGDNNVLKPSISGSSSEFNQAQFPAVSTDMPFSFPNMHGPLKHKETVAGYSADPEAQYLKSHHGLEYTTTQAHISPCDPEDHRRSVISKSSDTVIQQTIPEATSLYDQVTDPRQRPRIFLNVTNDPSMSRPRVRVPQKTPSSNKIHMNKCEACGKLGFGQRPLCSGCSGKNKGADEDNRQDREIATDSDLRVSTLHPDKVEGSMRSKEMPGNTQRPHGTNLQNYRSNQTGTKRLSGHDHMFVVRKRPRLDNSQHIKKNTLVLNSTKNAPLGTANSETVNLLRQNSLSASLPPSMISATQTEIPQAKSSTNSTSGSLKSASGLSDDAVFAGHDVSMQFFKHPETIGVDFPRATPEQQVESSSDVKLTEISNIRSEMNFQNGIDTGHLGALSEDGVREFPPSPASELDQEHATKEVDHIESRCLDTVQSLTPISTPEPVNNSANIPKIGRESGLPQVPGSSKKAIAEVACKECRKKHRRCTHKTIIYVDATNDDIDDEHNVIESQADSDIEILSAGRGRHDSFISNQSRLSFEDELDSNTIKVELEIEDHIESIDDTQRAGTGKLSDLELQTYAQYRAGKPCGICRKKKKRCLHDQRGNFDPLLCDWFLRSRDYRLDSSRPKQENETILAIAARLGQDSSASPGSGSNAEAQHTSLNDHVSDSSVQDSIGSDALHLTSDWQHNAEWQDSDDDEDDDLPLKLRRPTIIPRKSKESLSSPRTAYENGHSQGSMIMNDDDLLIQCGEQLPVPGNSREHCIPDEMAVKCLEAEPRMNIDRGILDSLRDHGVMVESDYEEDDLMSDPGNDINSSCRNIDPLWQPRESLDIFEVAPSHYPKYSRRQTNFELYGSQTRPKRKDLWQNLLEYQCRSRRRKFGNPHWEVNRNMRPRQVTTVEECEIHKEGSIKINPLFDDEVEQRIVCKTFAQFLGMPANPIVCSGRNEFELAFRTGEPVSARDFKHAPRQEKRVREDEKFPFITNG